MTEDEIRCLAEKNAQFRQYAIDHGLGYWFRLAEYSEDEVNVCFKFFKESFEMVGAM